MALPTTGSISLNQIHFEAGGASGTKCTINDSDIRGLIGKGSGIKMSFSEWRGAARFVPIATLDDTEWVEDRTFNTFSEAIVTIPDGTKSIIVMGGIGTNDFRNTTHTGVTIGGTAMQKVGSVANFGRYTFDSAIYALNYSSTGNKTVRFEYSNAQQSYGSGHKVIFLNKAFKDYTPSQINTKITETGDSTIFDHNSSADSFNVATATTITIFDDSGFYDVTINNKGQLSQGAKWPGYTGIQHTVGNRNSIYGWRNGAVGTFNAKYTQNDYGETVIAASWSESKFQPS